ncbi:antirestriction protein [Vibrio vulnificus]|uniref:antirestriction protein n=1 Tax=Vibrio vulnificus TaxID=672 RepID=UPI001028E13D|nr:antirestriction protein [Vibrio vulnificus]MCU8269330.1 antirestriction protein [Vibrio vulnificus]RZP95256.1 antirestriction protein [Vibrio vulnificus]RZR41750.1 antirestriction protein [Vibrio vulnificus]
MITASMVPVEERFNFFPSITKQYVHFEQAVFYFADLCIENYQGGYWEFVALSNGGLFCYPKMSGILTLTNSMNYADVMLSNEAAGICIMLMVLSRYSLIAWEQGDQKEVEHFAELHQQLYEFALGHTEWLEIAKFID